MEKVTFQEIITRMENATDYSELYDAASLIENESLRVDVEQLIGDCEDDGDSVETAYSVVTSDLLDSHVNEENLVEESKKVTESKEEDELKKLQDELRGVDVSKLSDEEYKEYKEKSARVSELMDKLYESKKVETKDIGYLNAQIDALRGIEATTFEELRNELERLLEEESIDDDEYDIFTDIVDSRESACVEYINRRGEVTNTDYEDELGIEEDYVSGAMDDMVDSINAVQTESKKITEGLKYSASDVQKWVKDCIEPLVKEDAGCAEFKLDNDLSIFCGWSNGYDEDDEGYIHSKTEPSWCIVVGIKSNHEYLKTDYDWMTTPYDKETGEVWDTDITIGEDGISESDAQYLLDQYVMIRESLDSGVTILESKKVEESADSGKTLYDWLEEKNFEPHIDIVDKDYDMMVAFEFTPEDADTDPYDSYMAMLAKQLKVLDDGNDILTVNMIDYVERNFDLLDAIFDISAEDREDEIEQLVCDVMPNVISGYTTDSVYTELLNNSKKVESKKLTEGAGAGYTVSGELAYEPQIKSFNVVSRENDIMEVECDIDGVLEDVTFESYNYGDKVDKADVHISHLTLDVCNLKDDDDNDRELDEYTLRDALDGLKVSPLIGGGWSHTTFDGDLSCEDSKVDCNAYSDIYVTGVQMNLTNSDLIDFIDKAVLGENIFTQYTVLSEDDDTLEVFDELEDAIEYAKENNGYKVQSSQFRYSFDEEVEDLFVDEVEWTRDGMNESKKIEEKTSLDDYKDYCNDLSIDYKKASSLNKYLNDFTNNEAKMNGISDVADKVNQLRKELKQGLKESRKVETAEKVVESAIKDESMFDEVMSFLWGEYIEDGYDLGDDEDIINTILRYTYLAHLVDLPKDEEDMETEEIVQVPAVQELLKRIREEDAKLRDIDTYEGELELSDRSVLSEISNEEMYNKLGDDGFMDWYWQEADAALEEFASNNGIDPEDITYSGRGARHILIPSTYQNAVRYHELKDAFEQFQDEFVERINSYSEEE